MLVDPTHSVLIGTYATERMGQIIADALEAEGIPVAIVMNGDEKEFPSLGLVGTGVGVFVPPESVAAAQEIKAAIEGDL